jgi:hypothetical protein
MSKEFQKGFKQGFALGTKIGHELGQQGCGSTDIEDILKNSVSPFAAMVDEKDPQALALGYKADTTKVNPKKFPNWKNDQKCTNCALYRGKSTDKAVSCPLFPGKQVAGNGWCTAYAKTAGGNDFLGPNPRAPAPAPRAPAPAPRAPAPTPAPAPAPAPAPTPTPTPAPTPAPGSGSGSTAKGPREVGK